MAATETIDGILVTVSKEKYDRNIDGFKVFLSNRESASFFLQQSELGSVFKLIQVQTKAGFGELVQ